jgi:type I restriction enzyme, S subunit
MRGQEVARKTLNLEHVRLAAVALPPHLEQHRIVADADRRLSLILVAEAQVAANLARAQRLRQSILQAAFSA